MNALSWLVGAASVAQLCSCGAGDGSSLDEAGESLAKPWAPALRSFYGEASFAPTFTGIQQGFFARFCNECHQGSSAPKGLDLTEPAAFERLVGVPSVERPDVMLVQPGSPQRSYLFQKLEGAGGISGRRMPRDRPPRPQSELDLIKDWIQSGAPRS